jgi:hypothetical protein
MPAPACEPIGKTSNGTVAAFHAPFGVWQITLDGL